MYRRGCLLALVGAFFPEVGDQKDAMCSFKCSGEGFRPIQVCFRDLVGEHAMLAWIAGQSAHVELAAGLQGTYDCASLLPRCADHGDGFLIARECAHGAALLMSVEFVCESSALLATTVSCPQLAFRHEPVLPLPAWFAAALFKNLVGTTGDVVVGRFARRPLDLLLGVFPLARHGVGRAG